MNNDGQKIIEIGETEALRRALNVFKPVATTLIGPGDDAAVISLSDSRVVITTDTMVQDHDFRLEWSSGFDIGYKAVTSNIADLVAMGAAPRALTVALVVTKETPQAWLEDFASGLQSACDRHAPECQIVGGDLASGEQIVVAIADRAGAEFLPALGFDRNAPKLLGGSLQTPAAQVGTEDCSDAVAIDSLRGLGRIRCAAGRVRRNRGSLRRPAWAIRRLSPKPRPSVLRSVHNAEAAVQPSL